MNYKDTVTDERVLDAITWGRGFSYISTMDRQGWDEDGSEAADGLFYAYNHKGLLVVLWNDMPSDDEMAGLSFGWEEAAFEISDQVAHWFINGDELFYLRGEGDLMLDAISRELKSIGISRDLFVSESTIRKIEAA